jgi:hypothetical protein
MSIKPSLVTVNVWKQLAVKLLPFSTPSAHRNILNNYVIAGIFVHKTAHTQIMQFNFLKFAIYCECNVNWGKVSKARHIVING